MACLNVCYICHNARKNRISTWNGLLGIEDELYHTHRMYQKSRTSEILLCVKQSYFRFRYNATAFLSSIPFSIPRVNVQSKLKSVLEILPPICNRVCQYRCVFYTATFHPSSHHLMYTDTQTHRHTHTHTHTYMYLSLIHI